MSQIMYLAVTRDIQSCRSMQDLEHVREKYALAFSSESDASEFKNRVKAKSLEFDFD